MLRGFLKLLNSEEKEDEERIINEEELWTSTVTYIINTLRGIHSGLAKLYLGIVLPPPRMQEELISKSRIGDSMFYEAIAKSTEGYFEHTAIVFLTKEDDYVNSVFDEFRNHLGGKLPCCFYQHLCLMMSAILTELANHQFELAKNQPANEVLECYLDELVGFMLVSLEQKKLGYLESVKKAVHSCSKTMEEAIQLNGSHGIVVHS